MTVLTAESLNDILGQRITGADAFYASFRMVFRTGTPPTNVNSSFTGTELITFDLPSGWATYNGTSLITMDDAQLEDTVNPGTATYFRLDGLKDPGIDALIQGDVSTSGNGGDIQFNDVVWPANEPINLLAFSIQLPPGTSS